MSCRRCCMREAPWLPERCQGREPCRRIQMFSACWFACAVTFVCWAPTVLLLSLPFTLAAFLWELLVQVVAWTGWLAAQATCGCCWRGLGTCVDEWVLLEWAVRHHVPAAIVAALARARARAGRHGDPDPRHSGVIWRLRSLLQLPGRTGFYSAENRLAARRQIVSLLLEHPALNVPDVAAGVGLAAVMDVATPQQLARLAEQGAPTVVTAEASGRRICWVGVGEGHAQPEASLVQPRLHTPRIACRQGEAAQGASTRTALEAAIRCSNISAVRWLLGRPEVAAAAPQVAACLQLARQRMVEHQTVNALLCLRALVAFVLEHGVLSDSAGGAVMHDYDTGADMLNAEWHRLAHLGSGNPTPEPGWRNLLHQLTLPYYQHFCCCRRLQDTAYPFADVCWCCVCPVPPCRTRRRCAAAPPPASLDPRDAVVVHIGRQRAAETAASTQPTLPRRAYEHAHGGSTLPEDVILSEVRPSTPCAGRARAVSHNGACAASLPSADLHVSGGPAGGRQFARGGRPRVDGGARIHSFADGASGVAQPAGEPCTARSARPHGTYGAGSCVAWGSRCEGGRGRRGGGQALLLLTPRTTAPCAGAPVGR
jgi:hypothetical protein